MSEILNSGFVRDSLWKYRGNGKWNSYTLQAHYKNMVNICVFNRGKFEHEKSFHSIAFDELILCDK